MANLKMPDKHRDALISLLALTSEDAADLVAEFEASNGKYEVLLGALNKRVESGRDALKALISLSLVQRDFEIELSELAAAIATSFDIEADVSALISLMGSSAVRKSAKAIQLRNTYERIYTDSQIVSDIRPIFPDGDVGDSIQAAMVNHTLKLSYRKSEGESGDVYLALDAEDLNKLRDQIERALSKESAARDFIESANAIVLEPTEGTK